MGALLYFAIIIAVFYFFLISPEKKKQNKAKQMVNELKVGDVILTRGGIQGKIVNLTNELVTIATGTDEVKITITRTAIGSVVQSAPDDNYDYDQVVDDEDEEYDYDDDDDLDEELEDEDEEKEGISLDKK